MNTSCLKLLAASIILLGIFTACAPLSPPESCGDNIGGTADQTLFSQYFNSMALVSQTTGQPGPEGENGIQFTAGEPLAIVTDSKAEVVVRACIQERVGGGKIPFDQTQTLQAGESQFAIDALEPGNYVIRVIVDGTLVKNFPFAIE